MRKDRAATPVRRNLEQRLLAYAAAAGASLVAAQPAAAKVIYTSITLTIDGTGTVPLDLNHDGVVDFNLVERSGFFSTRDLSINGAGNPGAAVVATSLGGASALAFGATIGPGDRFGKVQNVARNMASVGADHMFGTVRHLLGLPRGIRRDAELLFRRYRPFRGAPICGERQDVLRLGGVQRG